MSAIPSGTSPHFVKPVNHRNDFKVLMTITFSIFALITITVIAINIQISRAQYKRDLSESISQKVQIITISEPLFIESHSYFNRKTFCQQNTTTSNCSIQNLSIRQLENFNKKLDSVMNQLIALQTKLEKTRPSPTPPPPPLTPYKCPDTDYIGCMPGPGSQKPECKSDYLQWAHTNCPNFKGVAL